MATSQPLGLLLQYACRSLASLTLALVISWRLSLVTLAGIPIFSALIAYLSTRMNCSISAQQTELTYASKMANNAISSIDTVKFLNSQAFEWQSFVSRIEQSAIHYLRQARLNSFQIALIRWMMFGMFVQGFWYGSSLARAGLLSSGDVITTFWACTTAAQSIEQVLPQMIVMEKGKVASAILRNLMRKSVEDDFHSEIKGTVYPRRCDGDVEVNDVSIRGWNLGCISDLGSRLMA
jgi:ATP-binding cassette subfamily B (MDR/TAP) protein 1